MTAGVPRAGCLFVGVLLGLASFFFVMVLRGCMLELVVKTRGFFGSFVCFLARGCRGEMHVCLGDFCGGGELLIVASGYGCCLSGFLRCVGGDKVSLMDADCSVSFLCFCVAWVHVWVVFLRWVRVPSSAREVPGFFPGPLFFE